MNVSVDFENSLDDAKNDLFNRYYEVTLAKVIKVNRNVDM